MTADTLNIIDPEKVMTLLRRYVLGVSDNQTHEKLDLVANATSELGACGGDEEKRAQVLQKMAKQMTATDIVASQIVQTDTFCGTKYGLEGTGYEGQVNELNKRAAEIARAAVGNEVYVAGDIGPTGKKIAAGKYAKMANMVGKVGYDEWISEEMAKEAFKEQIKGLIAGGVDVLHIETMIQLPEVRAALEAIKEVTANQGGFPTFVTMSFSPQQGQFRTQLDSSTTAEFVELLAGYDVLAYGANCGTGTEDAEVLMQALKAGNNNAVLIAKLNVGVKAGQYLTPEEMVDYTIKMYDMNIKVIGACCESTPAHINAMANALRAKGALTS
jgi:5-methyltetrahydrofolate--homocysteine methyltransferase